MRLVRDRLHPGSNARGLIARGCVHEVPSGAIVTTGPDGSTVVTLNGSVVATYPPCPCAPPDGG